MIGRQIGPYAVLSKLGEGGMGEVYRAQDTKLGRDAAIKVLPEAFAAEPDRVARFRREAQLLASLNHPNIAQVYGIEDASGGAALAMEYVPGPDLSERLAAGPLPVPEALAIAKQIADALEAAHEQGIVHRDLKPANVKVRDDGFVKVLDFGLAKLVDPTAGDASHSGSAPTSAATQAPTMTSPALTRMGVILGTATYMSPEQAKGRPVDKRSDIWAFGCVLYEMLTGRRAFNGDDVSDTLAAILRGTPDWSALPPATPAGVRTVLRRCLEKDRRQRLRDIGDVQVLMDDIGVAEGAAAVSPVVRSTRSTALTWGLAAALLLALGALGRTYWLPSAPPAADMVRFSVTPPRDVALAGPGQFALSPDGRRLAGVGAGRSGPLLWVRDMETLDSRLLAGTDGAQLPFWSPDGRTIGFFAEASLKTIDAEGGPARRLCPAEGAPRGGTWSADDTIVFGSSAQAGLVRVSAVGGQPVQVTAPEGSDLGFRLPFFLPDGRRFLFQGYPSGEIRLGSLNSADSAVVLQASAQAVFASGHILFVRENVLLAQPFDAESGTLSGDAVPVADQLALNTAGFASFSASHDGDLSYMTGTAVENAQLTWVDRSGKPIATVGPPGPYRNPRLSPDGRQVAVEVERQDQNRDIWVLDAATGAARRLTTDLKRDVMPVWSPTGDRIAWGSNRDGAAFGIYQKPSNGLGADERLLTSPSEDPVPYSWVRDGNIIVHRSVVRGVYTMGLLSIADGKSRPYRLGSLITTGDVSPDGRWIAYQSAATGRFEVALDSFPTPGRERSLSTDGGFYPIWTGREVFYYAADGSLMAVPVSLGDRLELGAPRALFRIQMVNGPAPAIGFRAQYDVSADGQKFLINLPTDEVAERTITVVLNWTSQLRGR